jgi:DNA-binding transcriptional LysR family regulator
MIGCSPVATDCVSQAILELLKEMPTLHLNIEEKVMTPLLNDLLAGVVDVVVGRVGGRALELPLSYRVLYTEPVCFVARSPAGPEIAIKLGRPLSVALDRLAHRHANSPEHRQRAGG